MKGQRIGLTVSAVVALLVLSSVVPVAAEDPAPESLPVPAAPDSVLVRDIRNDAGQALHVSWKRVPGDLVRGYAVFRSEHPEGPFAAIDTVDAGTSALTDVDRPASPL